MFSGAGKSWQGIISDIFIQGSGLNLIMYSGKVPVGDELMQGKSIKGHRSGLESSPIQLEVNNSQQQFEAIEEENTRVSGPTSLINLSSFANLTSSKYI